MTQDEIVKMAREAGLIRAGDGWTEPHRWGLAEIERFAALVAAHEREECANIAQAAAQHWYEFAMAKDSRVDVGATAYAAAELVAKAIREGKTP